MYVMCISIVDGTCVPYPYIVFDYVLRHYTAQNISLGHVMKIFISIATFG